MGILIKDPNYPRTGEIDDNFVPTLKVRLEQTLSKTELEYVDAGAGASDPSYFVYVLELIALGLALFSTPSILKENAHLWKRCFDKVVEVLNREKLRYFIDAQTAKCLVAFYVLNKIGGGYATLNLISLQRHAMNIVGRVDNLPTSPTSEKIKDEHQKHVEALNQVFCRYIACVEVDVHCYTVVVEADGRCTYIERLP